MHEIPPHARMSSSRSRAAPSGLGTKKADLSDDDVAHMRKVSGYVKRHVAQRPSGDVSDTAWRYSLMNWGHDPTT